MKQIGWSILFIVLVLGCTSSKPSVSLSENKRQINFMLDYWHDAASNANFESYFSKMTPNTIFIGTDATEHWNLEEFKRFSKPYFDKGKAWSFKSLERNVYLEDDNKTGWFDELLDTQMGVCRGSGVVRLTKDGWKIEHYVLSIAIPNENVNEVVSLKKIFDTEFVSKY